MLLAVEGVEARPVAIDPRTGEERTDLDLGEFLNARECRWAMSSPLAKPGVGDVLLIRLMTLIPKRAKIAEGHKLVDVGYAQVERGEKTS